MAEGKQIIGQATIKKYKCTNCGNVERFTTNHYGQIYNTSCSKCSWKGGHLRTWDCLEPLPDGWDRPTPWTEVKIEAIR